MLSLVLSAVASYGQADGNKLIPNDTLWIYYPEADSLVLDSLRGQNRTKPNTSDGVYDVEIPDFMYKSPEAFAFKKYGEYRVNEYTGCPNISVPLYTLKYKDIEIPIELTYDASGIRVDQEASWVGLGWNMLVGGCINYVASGAVDPKSFLASQDAWQTLLTTDNQEFYRFSSSLSGNSSLVVDVNSGHGERDYYSVRILDKSFLFMFDPFTRVISVIGKDQDKYRVEDLNNSPYASLNYARWKITDADGVQYIFDIGERTDAYVIGGAYTSTWYLTQIITPEGSVVNFTYSGENMIVCRGYRSEQYDVVSGSNPTYYPTPGYSSQMVLSDVNVYARYLTGISTADQQLTFTLEARNDIPSGKRLKKMTVKSLISQKTIKEFNFNYDYFTASTVGGNYLNDHATTTYTNDLYYRLRLNSVEEKAGTISQTTSFEYNNTKLPLKTSCAKDFWGYFNNQENAGSEKILNAHTLLPNPLPLFASAGITMTNIYRILKGANRYCNGTYMQAGILTKIIYPTKGYTSFEYEPNDFTTLSATKFPTTAQYNENIKSAIVTDSNNPNEVTYRQISLTQPANGLITVTFHGQLSTLKSNSAAIHLYPMSGSGTSYTYDLNLASDEQIAFDSDFSTTIDIDLPANNYILTAYCPNNLGTSFSVHASISMTQKLTNANVPVSTGGGLRVKSIRNYNHDNVLQYYTVYEYLNTDGKSSGKLLQPLSLDKGKTVICAYQSGPEPGSIQSYDYNVHRLKMPHPDMTAFYAAMSGGTVGYSRVTRKEYDGNNTLLGATIMEFSNSTPQNTWNVYHFTDFGNGNILSETVMNANGTKLKTTRYTYAHETQSFRCNAIVDDKVIDHTDYGYSLLSRYTITLYPFKTCWSKLTQTVDSVFDGSTSQRLVNTYTYYSENHRVATQEFNSSDSNINYITRYKYPFNYSTYPYNTMSNTTNYHMLNPIIEQSLSAVEGNTEKLIKSRKDEYTYYNNKHRDIDRVTFLKTSSSFALNGGTQQLRLSYTYNNSCDLTDITKDQEKVAYLWAYNNNYPVAEIKGATYSNLSSWGLSNQMSNLVTKTSESEISTTLDAIRNSLATRPVLMTSYTYDPLIGMTSMTTPNGTKTTYVYDEMGRLSTVKNHNGTILQNHTYNYKNN